MPIKNIIKTYVENGYYHIYNRGIDKKEIFLEKQDCIVFQHYLKLYLSPKEILLKEPLLPPRMIHKIYNLNLSSEIDLLSFTLMPNHFHFQVKQYTKNGIEKFTRRILSSYSQYFNNKYKRKGPLYESTYKAASILNDKQNIYLSCYIHRNTLDLKNPKFNFTEFSSYPYYLGNKRAKWIKPEEILSCFNNSKHINDNNRLSYKNFVDSFDNSTKTITNEITMEERNEA